MKRKALAVLPVSAALILALAAPALAHVTTDPESAPKGAEITLGFRVPSEEGAANTVQVEVDFPTDHPILGVDVEPLPGWTSKVTNKQLIPPVQTDDGPVTESVSQIIWSGGSLLPGQFEEFKVLAQQLPTDTDQVVFKALQTYSNGDIVRWIDPVEPGQPSPDHPTPILKLTAAATDSPTPANTKTTAGPAGATVDVSRLAKKTSVDTATTMSIIAIVIGLAGLVVALLARFPWRRPAPRGAGYGPD